MPRDPIGLVWQGGQRRDDDVEEDHGLRGCERDVSPSSLEVDIGEERGLRTFLTPLQTRLIVWNHLQLFLRSPSPCKCSLSPLGARSTAARISGSEWTASVEVDLNGFDWASRGST